jgi:uncharacterized membrane protein YcjF (UPF0283 family)
MDDTPATNIGSIRKGILLTLGLHAGAALVCCAVGLLSDQGAIQGLAPFLGIGVVQIVYIVPALVVYSVKREWRTRKGLWIGAGITVLVNAACAGIVLASIRY